jgi:hypothetical protein
MRALTPTLLGLAMAVVPAAAQTPAGSHTYDPKAEVTVTGTVVDVHEAKAKDDHPGLHFILRLAAEPATGPKPAPAPGVGEQTPEVPVDNPQPGTVEVHACPVRLLSQLDFPIEKGDELTVTGSRPNNGPVLIAREIKKGLTTLQLRDEKGVPIWVDLP